MDTAAVFIASYLYLFVLLMAAIYFFTRSKAVMKRMIVCSAIVAPIAYALSRISALFYYDARPFVAGHFTPLIAHAADNGFPSDHVLLTGAAAMIVWFFNRRLGVGLWACALLIGWARVYAGIHHWADIWGSVGMVLAASAVYYLIFEYKKNRAR